ncbi:MAG: class I SAM-dependent methyltransferase [Propioniciclava sp.]
MSEPTAPAEYWETQYSENPRRWSGRVNQTLADVVQGLPAGVALDLGCGEGGDAVWLAEQGWQVVAVDISATAISRGAEGADMRGVGDKITWVARDLSTWASEQTFDLVTASFFHSTVELPRTAILRRAADQVRPGGHLLVVSHVIESIEDVPPWAVRHHGTDDNNDPELERHASILLTPDQEITELALDPAQWDVVLEEVRGRETIGPDGAETAIVKDGVVLMRRSLT